MVDEEFLDLVFSDEEFLHAEFDAIIAAAWGTPTRGGGQAKQRSPTFGAHHPSTLPAECGSAEAVLGFGP